jgi:pyruvate dehydrogenase E2 component (dihydrolipoamide acetyltransferase)
MAEVRMPKMGDGMEEGTINAWLKKEGDAVNAGEPIAEVETDKANVEISAYESGILTRIVVQVGQTVPVGEVIAQIGAEAAAKGNGAQTPAGGPATADAKSRPTTSGNGGKQAGAGEEGKAPPVAEPGPQPAPSAAPSSGAPESERVKSSPLARRVAESLGIDIAQVRGTGPGGRIVERDVLAFQAQAPPHPAPVMPSVPPSQRPVSTPPPVTAPVGRDIKPSRMREAIARRTVQSKQTQPHFYETMVIEMDRALALLKELNADVTDGKITVNDIIVKSCATALAKVPEVNATWTPEGTIRRYAEAHIGVAVGIEEGLIIPVIRDCQSKTLRQISAEAKVLIGKARANQLKPEEYSGGTFSISNLGMMGVDEFIAIINPPEAAILAIGSIVREPVVLDDSDAIVIRSRMKVTLSSDHRLLDGVIAARFLQEVKRALESPYSLVA